jgi:hypothetical protein
MIILPVDECQSQRVYPDHRRRQILDKEAGDSGQVDEAEIFSALFFAQRRREHTQILSLKGLEKFRGSLCTQCCYLE